MKLKLFRSTEFAQSSMFVPSLQRAAWHPAWVAFLVAIWIAGICNAALWRDLPALFGAERVNGWLILQIATLIAATSFAVFSFFSSRRLLKPLVIATLLAASAGFHLAFNLKIDVDAAFIKQALATRPLPLHALSDWRLWVSVLIIAIIPSIMLWRTPILRLSIWQYVKQNFTFAVLAIVIVLATLGTGAIKLTDPGQTPPALLQKANPFGLLHAFFS